MTPAILLAKKAKIIFNVHEHKHDQKAQSYGLEAAEKLGLNPSQVFKTLVVDTDSKQLAVAVLPVNQQLNLKSLAKDELTVPERLSTDVENAHTIITL